MSSRITRQLVFLVLGLIWVPVLATGQTEARKTAPQAQVPPVPVVPVVPPGFNSDANEVREELRSLFQQYPPTLREVLMRDPSLLTNASYLSPYPALATFLGQHPEIAHNPA